MVWCYIIFSLAEGGWRIDKWQPALRLWFVGYELLVLSIAVIVILAAVKLKKEGGL